MNGASISELLARRRPGYALEQAFYTDPDVFQQDMEKIFQQRAKYWTSRFHVTSPRMVSSAETAILKRPCLYISHDFCMDVVLHRTFYFAGENVVLYFYPKAFTQGCTLEANAFAEAMPEFREAGASVVGMSNDDIETLERFSKEECRDAFPVGVADPDLIAAYDVALGSSGLASRTSYVIAPDRRIVLVHSDSDYRSHVAKTLAAVRELSK